MSYDMWHYFKTSVEARVTNAALRLKTSGIKAFPSGGCQPPSGAMLQAFLPGIAGTSFLRKLGRSLSMPTHDDKNLQRPNGPSVVETKVMIS